MKRSPVMIDKMMVGGRLVNVHHINGRPVELRRTSNSQRQYVYHKPVHGTGWMSTVGSIISNPVVQGIAKAIAQKVVGGSVDKKLNREQIMDEINKEFSGKRTKK